MARVLAPPAAALAVLAALAGWALAVRAGQPVSETAFTLFVVACAAAGGLVVLRRPDLPVGYLLLGSALSFALAEGFGRVALVLPEGPLAAVLGWPQTWLWVPGNALLGLVPLAVAEARATLLRWTVLAAGAITAPVSALRPGPDTQLGVLGRPNPLGVPAFAGWADTVAAGFTLVVGAVFLAGGVLVVRRWWRTPREDPLRQRLQWPVWAVVTAGAVVLLRLGAGALDADPALWPVGDPVWEVAGSLAVALLPVAVAVGILRYRLVDVDRLFARTILFGTVTVGVLGLYLAVVTVAVQLLGPTAGPPASALVAAAAALAAEPLRRRLQRHVERLLYGERGDPYAVLVGLGARLEGVPDRAALTEVVEAVRTSLRLPAVALYGPEGELAVTGTLPATPVVLPLRSGGERVGELRLAPRAGESGPSRGEGVLLGELARPIAAVVRAVREAERAEQLTNDLRRSRQRLVLAAEEERRRLRRDLHDGLGPTLAGLTMRAETARELGDTEQGRQLLEEIVRDAATALADVRRLIDGLRPPALDTLGLAGALRAHLAARPPGTAPATLIDRLGDVTPAAAAEVAAFRIAVEAVANADRHAHASQVTVVLTSCGVQVVDDGVGLPESPRAGVGLGSMRARAAELGGSCTIRARAEGGTEVLASLPEV